MEVLKNSNTSKTTSKKLSYEDLENAAKQISVQAEALAKENLSMREALSDKNFTYSTALLNFQFKVLKYAEWFDAEFVEQTAKNIAHALTPVKDNKEEEKEEEEDESTEGE